MREPQVDINASDPRLDAPIPRLWRRFFGLALFASGAIATLSTVGLTRNARVQAIRHAESNGTRAAAALIDALPSGNSMGLVARFGDTERARLDKRFAALLAPYDIVKVKLYDTDGTIVHSTDPAVIGQTNADNADLRAALAGHTVSEFKAPGDVWDLAGEAEAAQTIVETYVPALDDGGGVLGVVETYADVSGSVDSWLNYAIPAFCTVLLVILPTFGALGFMMRRLDRAIALRTSDLRRARDELATVIATTSALIVTVDTDLRITGFNERASRVSGLARHAVIGEPVRAALGDNGSAADLTERLGRAIAGEPVEDFAAPLRCADDSTRRVSWSISQWRDAEGRVLGASAFGQDLTDLQRVALYERILPICSYCKQIRDADGEWTAVETYVSSHSKSQFSHGICPDCLERARSEARGTGSG